jgi:hypothetical protein
MARVPSWSARENEGSEKAMSGLQGRLDEFRKAFESGAPPYNAPHEVIESMHRATAELKASGIEQQALKIGDRAPSFTLFNQDHVEVSSTGLLRQGAGNQLLSRTLVTLLQHGTGGSTANHGEVRALGAQIVVLTPELERYTRALHKKLNLSFDILTDLHLKTAE